MSDREWHKELVKSITDPTGKLRIRQAEVTAFNGQTRVVTCKIGGSSVTADIPAGEQLWPEVGRSVWVITDGIDAFAFAQVDGGRAAIGRASKSADQGVANNTTETMLLDTADVDPIGMVKLGSDWIEAVVPGYYRAWANCAWATTSGAGQRTLQLFKNSTKIDQDNRGGTTAFSVYQKVYWELDMATGDYVQAKLFQDSGAGAQSSLATTATPTLGLSYIGPRP